MKEHILKTDPAVFDAVWIGAKTYEIRFDDRNYQVGDNLRLLETKHSGVEMKAGAPLEYTGREVTKTVSHVLSSYGLMHGWRILSFTDDRIAALERENAQLREALESKPSGAVTEDEIEHIALDVGLLNTIGDHPLYESKLINFARAILSARAQAGQSEKAIQDAALEKAAKVIESYEFMMDREECTAAIRALKSSTHAQQPEPEAQSGYKQDAERYRWLRGDTGRNGFRFDGPENMWNFEVKQKVGPGHALYYRGNSLDAAIDAAMSAEKKGADAA